MRGFSIAANRAETPQGAGGGGGGGVGRPARHASDAGLPTSRAQCSSERRVELFCRGFWG